MKGHFMTMENLFSNLIENAINRQTALILDAIRDINKQQEQAAKQAVKQENDNLLSRNEVAEKFGVSLVTVNSWVTKGILTSVKIGGRRFFKESEIVSLLNVKG